MSTIMSAHPSLRTPMSRIAGVVLCGGRSTRMGSDKSQLRYRGLALSEYMSGLLRQAGVEHTFLSGPDGIRDILQDRGPLGGMHACMNALAADFSHLLFVPVDMPLLRPEQLRRLSLEASAAEALHYAEQVFPLRLVLSPRVRGKLAMQLAEGEQDRRSIKELMRALDSEALPQPEPATKSFINVNTPQEWQALHDRLSQGTA